MLCAAQAVDLSALSAQAVAQVERARQAAQQQITAALQSRPKLALRLFLEGPKIAIPVPATQDGQGAANLPPVEKTLLQQLDSELLTQPYIII